VLEIDASLSLTDSHAYSPGGWLMHVAVFVAQFPIVIGALVVISSSCRSFTGRGAIKVGNFWSQLPHSKIDTAPTDCCDGWVINRDDVIFFG
jgi:hypothetical protein